MVARADELISICNNTGSEFLMYVPQVMADCSRIVDYPPLLRHREELREQSRARARRLMIGLPTGLMVVVAAFAVSVPLGMLVAVIITGVMFFLGMPGSSSVDAGELAGIEGEVAVLQALKTLPDDYVVLNRVKLPDETLTNGWRELDFIVAGPTGLWVIEVKNSPGHIQVQPDERHWPLARRGCGSAPNWNAIRNPIPQAQAQVNALQRWLLRHGLNEQPRPMVVLAHPETALTGADESDVPVLLRDQVSDTLSQADPTRLPPRLFATLTRLR